MAFPNTPPTQPFTDLAPPVAPLAPAGHYFEADEGGVSLSFLWSWTLKASGKLK